MKIKKIAILVFSIFALSACGEAYTEDKIRDVYNSKSDCEKDWKVGNCEDRTRNYSGGGFFYAGPYYYASSRSYNGFAPSSNLSTHKYSSNLNQLTTNSHYSSLAKSGATGRSGMVARGGFGGRGASGG